MHLGAKELRRSRGDKFSSGIFLDRLDMRRTLSNFWKKNDRTQSLIYAGEFALFFHIGWKAQRYWKGWSFDVTCMMRWCVRRNFPRTIGLMFMAPQRILTNSGQSLHDMARFGFDVKFIGFLTELYIATLSIKLISWHISEVPSWSSRTLCPKSRSDTVYRSREKEGISTSKGMIGW